MDRLRINRKRRKTNNRIVNEYYYSKSKENVRVEEAGRFILIRELLPKYLKK